MADKQHVEWVKREIANHLMKLTYGELYLIANEFAEMVDSHVRYAPSDVNDFMSIFHDWAEATVTE